jgi:hypothetical protein
VTFNFFFAGVFTGLTRGLEGAVDLLTFWVRPREVYWLETPTTLPDFRDGFALWDGMGRMNNEHSY